MLTTKFPVMLCYVNLIVFWYVTPCKCWYIPVYQTTRSHKQTDRRLDMHSHENLESQVEIFIYFFLKNFNQRNKF